MGVGVGVRDLGGVRRVREGGCGQGDITGGILTI